MAQVPGGSVTRNRIYFEPTPYEKKLRAIHGTVGLVYLGFLLAGEVRKIKALRGESASRTKSILHSAGEKLGDLENQNRELREQLRRERRRNRQPASRPDSPADLVSGPDGDPF